MDRPAASGRRSAMDQPVGAPLSRPGTASRHVHAVGRGRTRAVGVPANRFPSTGFTAARLTPAPTTAVHVHHGRPHGRGGRRSLLTTRPTPEVTWSWHRAPGHTA